VTCDKIGTVFAVTGAASSLGKPEKDTATLRALAGHWFLCGGRSIRR
jgi:hypothetical protein